MVSFPTDEEIRLGRLTTQQMRLVAHQRSADDVEFLKQKYPAMSSEEASDISRSLFIFHLKKVKGELEFDGNQR